MTAPAPPPDPGDPAHAPPSTSSPSAPTRAADVPPWVITVLRDLVPLLSVPVIIVWRLAEGGDLGAGWLGLITAIIGVPILARAGGR